jgi:cyanophycinase
MTFSPVPSSPTVETNPRLSRRQCILGATTLGVTTMLGTPLARAAARKQGHLVVVGGAEDRIQDRAVWHRFVELCGGPQARIVLCTAASGDPDGAWDGYQPLLQSLGLTQVQHLRITSPDEANTPAVTDQILAADGVFLTGGDQRRLMERLWETSAARAIHLAFHLRGCTIGGTSAGAAVMSRAMLAIGEATPRPEKDVISLDIGLGLVPRAIVDQHFNERGRLARLMSAIAQRPDLLGVGIDEDTALVITRDQGIEVVGHGNVTLVDGRRMETNARELGPDEQLEMLGLQLHALPCGHRYTALPDGEPLPSGVRRLPQGLHEAIRLLVEPGPIRG